MIHNGHLQTSGIRAEGKAQPREETGCNGEKKSFDYKVLLASKR